MNKRQKWLKIHELKEKDLSIREIGRGLNIPRTDVFWIIDEPEPLNVVRCNACGKEFVPENDILYRSSVTCPVV